MLGHPAEVGGEASFGLLASARHPARGFGDRGDHAVTDVVEERLVQVAL